MFAKYLLPVCAALPLFTTVANAQEEPSPTPSGTPIWSYDGDDNNQERWGDLSVDFAACLLGLNQSPIQISYTDVKELPKIVPQYHESLAHIMYKDNALVINVDGDNILKIGRKNYHLKYLMFHSPGEHWVLGKFFVAEVQLYHVDDQGNPLVLSSLVEVTSYVNDTLDLVLQNLPHKQVEKGITKDVRLNPKAFLPDSLGYYAYKGSGTIPPCTENVEWRVLKKSAHISEFQLKSLARYLGRNGRMAQPVYTRTILESKD